jgi:hypothetical protein
MGYGSWPDGLPKKDGANALSGAGSLDTATTRLSKTSRTKNLIIEFKETSRLSKASFSAWQRGRSILVISKLLRGPVQRQKLSKKAFRLSNNSRRSKRHSL